MLVRAAVVAGLHQGLLYSRELLVRPWDGRTRVVRCPPLRPMRRSEVPEPLADPAMWPGVDASALDPDRRAVYLRREQAVRAWLAGASLAGIEKSLGVDRGTLRRLVERCLMPHTDGRIQGLRALIPHSRTRGLHPHRLVAVAGRSRRDVGRHGPALRAAAAACPHRRARDRRGQGDPVGQRPPAAARRPARQAPRRLPRGGPHRPRLPAQPAGEGLPVAGRVGAPAAAGAHPAAAAHPCRHLGRHHAPVLRGRARRSQARSARAGAVHRRRGGRGRPGERAAVRRRADRRVHPRRAGLAVGARARVRPPRRAGGHPGRAAAAPAAGRVPQPGPGLPARRRLRRRRAAATVVRLLGRAQGRQRRLAPDRGHVRAGLQLRQLPHAGRPHRRADGQALHRAVLRHALRSLVGRGRGHDRPQPAGSRPASAAARCRSGSS